MGDANSSVTRVWPVFETLIATDPSAGTLVYPLKPATYERLLVHGRERSVAELLHGGRVVRLELRGLPFGRAA